MVLAGAFASHYAFANLFSFFSLSVSIVFFFCYENNEPENTTHDTMMHVFAVIAKFRTLANGRREIERGRGREKIEKKRPSASKTSSNWMFSLAADGAMRVCHVCVSCTIFNYLHKLILRAAIECERVWIRVCTGTLYVWDTQKRGMRTWTMSILFVIGFGMSACVWVCACVRRKHRATRISIYALI